MLLSGLAAALLYVNAVVPLCCYVVKQLCSRVARLALRCPTLSIKVARLLARYAAIAMDPIVLACQVMVPKMAVLACQVMVPKISM